MQQITTVLTEYHDGLLWAYRHIGDYVVGTTYNASAAAAANMAATTQMLTLGKLMSDDRNTKSQGYLKINTIHPNEGIIGYMIIRRKKGQSMTVNIPVGESVCSFNWDVSKKKK